MKTSRCWLRSEAESIVLVASCLIAAALPYSGNAAEGTSDRETRLLNEIVNGNLDLNLVSRARRCLEQRPGCVSGTATMHPPVETIAINKPTARWIPPLASHQQYDAWSLLLHGRDIHVRELYAPVMPSEEWRSSPFPQVPGPVIHIDRASSEAYLSPGLPEAVRRNLHAAMARSEGLRSDYAANLKRRLIHAFAYERLGEYQRALEQYDAVILLEPNHASSLHNRGEMRRRLGQNQAAIDDFTAAIRLGVPQAALTFNNRGAAYIALAQPDRAIRDFDDAIGLDPKLAMAYSNRGIAYTRLGLHQRAIEDFDRAIRIIPQYAVAFQNRAYAYSKVEKYSRAIDDLDVAIRHEPRNPELYRLRAEMHKRMRNFRQAMDDLNVATTIAPGNAHAYADLAILLSTSGEEQLRDARLAVEHALKACALTHRNDLYSILAPAVAHAAIGKVDAAWKGCDSL